MPGDTEKITSIKEQASHNRASIDTYMNQFSNTLRLRFH